jgi:hypothetical protein
MMLTRVVSRARAQRFGQPSLAWLTYAKLSWLIPVGIGVAFVAVFVVGVMSPRMQCCFCGSKVDVAKATVKKYAYEAYPSWREAHPTVSCPRTPLDLNEYMNNKNLLDPWGTTYQFYCTDNHLDVLSAGEDRRFGTGDDVWSND